MSVPARCVLVLLAWLFALTSAQAGHEFPFYPSFYPQEITIEAVDPASAAARLEKGSIHAYVGGDPFGGKPAPANVGRVEFFGSYVIVTVNPASSTSARDGLPGRNPTTTLAPLSLRFNACARP